MLLHQPHLIVIELSDMTPGNHFNPPICYLSKEVTKDAILQSHTQQVSRAINIKEVLGGDELLGISF